MASNAAHDLGSRIVGEAIAAVAVEATTLQPPTDQVRILGGL